MIPPRSPDDRNLFGLTPRGEEWRLSDSGDTELEAIILGPTTQRRRATSIASPVALSRWRWGTACFLVIFGVLFARSAMLQVVQGEELRTIAEANRTRMNVIPAHRGVMKDRKGVELAVNEPAFRLLVWPGDLPEDEAERNALLTRLAQDLHLTAEMVIQKVSAAEPDEQALISEEISYEDALAFLSHQDEYKGLTVEFAERRSYLTTHIPTLSHVLGYTGPVTPDQFEALRGDGYRRFDVIGKQGLEAQYEELLRGEFGEEVVEVNAIGSAQRVLSRREAVNGRDLTLTLDTQLQAYIEQVLAERLQINPVGRASVVVLEPHTGEVLALVAVPGFDANAFTSGISAENYAALISDPDAPLFPRVYAGEYPSGSVIKPMFAAAALTNGTITTSTTFVSSGGVMLGNRFFPDWRPGGHGVTNVYHAIADSVNTFFYMIGGGNESFPGMGLEKLMTAALSFGYGQETGIDLPGEADGFLPSKAWKEETKGEPWYIGDTYNVSIGQGDFLVTPLQVARATAVFANGGSLVTPHLVMGETTPQQNILTPEVTDIVRDGMRQTVTAGSAQGLQGVPVAVAGKTGTAQWSQIKEPHSWFTGFAPFESPEIVITVLVEQGGKDSLAIPITRDILNWYFTQNPENSTP